MNYTFQTTYSREALAVMSRALRRTLRHKRSRRAHIFGWTVIAVSPLLLLPAVTGQSSPGVWNILTWLAIPVLLLALIWEDRINGYFAWKRMLPGNEHTSSVFGSDGYRTVTEAGETQWHYDRIAALAETDKYFVIVLGENHGQLYDKSSLSGGSADDFRKFIEGKTGMAVQRV